MNFRRTMKFMNAMMIAWVEKGHPHTFQAACLFCGKPVYCREREGIFTCRCIGCGEEI